MKQFIEILPTRMKTVTIWFLAVVLVLTFTLSVLSNYGHPIVSYNTNPVSITFPRAGRIVLWNVLTSGSPGYFSRYYFIRNGCRVGQNCAYIDVVNRRTVLTSLTVSAGETIQIKGCDCYGGNCGSGGCAYPHVGWKTPHHNYFCPNYFYTQYYDPSRGGRDFSSTMSAFLASGDTIIGSPQCWGDWDEDNSNGRYDHDFEDFVLVWAYRDTFTGHHDGASGTVSPEQCLASGWVKQDGAPGLDIHYRILVDGMEVAGGTANQYRSDLSSTCTGGTCSFSQSLWGLLSPGDLHTIRVQGQNPYSGKWFDLPGTGKNLRCTNPPEVDLKVNDQDAPLNLPVPADYTLSWSSANADTCSASGSWTGNQGLNGVMNVANVPVGEYTYTLTCTNPIGSASDTVTMTVYQPPAVDLKINDRDGPLTFVSPADYTLSWISQDAGNCLAGSSANDWTGIVAVSGDQPLNDVAHGSYTYTLTCSNAYETVSDSVLVTVLAPLRGSISATYARLVLLASELDQPAQTLGGEVSGGIPPYSVEVFVRAPSGSVVSFARNGTNWSVTPEEAGDPNFGTAEEGIWTTWAVLQDNSGQNHETVSVTWEVSWHPVHGLP